MTFGDGKITTCFAEASKNKLKAHIPHNKKSGTTFIRPCRISTLSMRKHTQHLLDFNHPLSLLNLLNCELRQSHMKHTVLNRSGYLVLIHIVRQYQCLLE